MYNEKKQYLVIGCGRFGTSVAVTLEELGHQVMAIDIDEDAVQRISDQVTYSAIVDTTDEHALKDLGLSNFDAVIVGIGSDLRAAIMAILVSKEMGVKRVICKAADEVQSKVMLKLGADNTIMPEKDVGRRLAHSLVSRNILDQMILGDELSIYEINVPKKWIGKSIANLDLRKQYNVNVIGIKRRNKMILTIEPQQIFMEDDIVIVASDSKILKHFEDA